MARRKPRPQRFVVRCDTWLMSIRVFCGGPIEAAEKEYKKRCADVTFEMGRGGLQACVLKCSDSKGVVMWFSDSQPGGGVVAHEAIHAAWHVLEYSGVHLAHDNHEALAYLVDHIVRAIGRKVW